MRRTSKWLTGVIALGLAATGLAVTLPYVSAARALVAVTGQPAWAVPYAPSADAVTHADLDVPTRHGPIPARVYRPAGTASRTLVVVPGIHAGGVEQPRLADLSARLAATGAVVVSVPLPDLRRYVVTPASTDQIEDVVTWVAGQPALAPEQRVGLVGVSFAGGLAVAAAGRPAMRDRLTSVLSIGGHADLPRVMTFLCTGDTPGGGSMAPHDYGVAIILYGAADRLVPAADVTPLRRAMRTYLDAASAVGTGADDARALAAEAARLVADLPGDAQVLAELMLARDVETLGARLLPHVEALGGAPSLSPARSPAPGVPVFLLHGEADDLIPAGESRRLAADLRARGTPEVDVLVTPLLRHIDVRASATALEAWQLVRFWAGVMSAG